jgi:pilus assembly protein CpaB
MRSKSVLLLVVALGCGVVASVAVSQVVLNQNDRQEVQTVSILVASKDLSAALKVPMDGFRVEQWPADRVPLGAISDPKMVENKFLKQRLYVGEPFLEAKLSSKGKEFSVPVGFRIFDIPVKDESGGSGYIGPGDRVDVFGYFATNGRTQSAKSVKVIENLEVVMIDGVAVVDMEATSQKKPSTIQLLVKDSQYIVLDTAANLGKLRLALCPPQQASSTPAREDNGEEFMEWLKQSETSEVNANLPIAESVHLPTGRKASTDSHEMTIVSATKSTRYKMVDGQMVVQKNADTDLDGSSSFEGNTGAGYSPYTSPFKANSATGTNSKSPQGAGSIPASELDTAPQPNLTWDPNTGVWQSGGFKATYPSGK